MDTRIIEESMALSMASKITFPQAVGMLVGAGVERYTVDLVGLREHAYGPQGEYHAAALKLPNPQPVAETFDGAAVKATITDIQQGKITYQEFLNRVMAAGCSHYECFITGRKVVYISRDGSQHVEFFPSK